jgi:23S rRNA pseudouridine1911/1915/1917 synthase
MHDEDDFADLPDEDDAPETDLLGGRQERRAQSADAGMRLDQFWARELDGVSRERVKEWIAAGLASIGGRACAKPGQRLEGYETLVLDAPELVADSAPRPEPGDLAVLYRDADIAVVAKPAGLTTHPAASQPDGTLVNRLLNHFPELAPEISGMDGDRPGIVHRLDKDTSGLILVALTEAARLTLSQAFADRSVHKTYLAVVHGVPQGDQTGRYGEDAGLVDLPIGRHPSLRTKMAVLKKGGREARTGWRRLWTDRLGRASLLAVTLHTGRTHQIRVHMAQLGHPLLGDPVYGPARHAAWLKQPGPLAALAPRQMLHAFRLAFEHPETGETMAFRQDPPEDFMALLRGLAADCQRVVVTGAPGCGKSAFTRALAQAPDAPPVFSADASVAALYGPGGHGAGLIARQFGRDLLAADGSVDRKALLDLLMQKPALRRELEQLVHPLVRHELEAFWTENSWRELAVAEVPLFFETGWRAGGERADTAADVVVGVNCPEEKRRGELRTSRHLPPEVLDAFESWQWPAERKLAACQLIAQNAGSLDDLQSEALRILKALRALRAERQAAFEAELAGLLDAVAAGGDES